MQEALYSIAKKAGILAYLVIGPIICATLFFYKPVIILAVGILVGISISGVLTKLSPRDPGDAIEQEAIDTEAKLTVLICSILFVGICVYFIYISWHDYQSLRHSPIYGVGMIYAPSVVVGLSVWACARYLTQRLGIFSKI
jgi:hypothetical protein